MTKKLLLIILSVFLLLVLFPSSALAADENMDGYDDNDFNKIQAFLNQISNDGSTTNGKRLHTVYNPNAPNTWLNVTWTDDTPKRVKEIVWSNKGLAGSLDLSGFTSLTRLICAYSNVTSIDFTGDTALTIADIPNNELTSLDIDANLTRLNCSFNKIEGTLDLSGMTALEALYCEYNKITQLNISGCTNLQYLSIYRNNISGTLDVSECDDLYFFYCFENSLSSLKLPPNTFTQFDYLLTRYNKLKSISIGDNQTFTANGDGYINLTLYDGKLSLTSEVDPSSNSMFYNWTYEGTTEASKSPIHYLDLAQPPTVDIQANFKPALTSNPSDGIIYTGGRVIFTPLFTGGEWQYDSTYIQADFTNPNKPVFKALKPGKTQISYTVSPYTYETEPGSVGVTGISEDEEGNYTVTLDITIKDSLLPVTGQNFTLAIILALTGLITAAAVLITMKKKNKHA